MYDEDDFLYRKIFRDICLGYSKLNLKKEVLYLKHLHANDYIHVNEKEKFFLEKAKKRGIPEEEEALAQIFKDGIWTEEDENFIDSQSIFIKNLLKTKDNLNLKSERDAHQKIIDEEQEKLNKKKLERNNLLGNTAEAYASKQANDFFIVNSFYSDESLLTKHLTDDMFDNLSYSEIKSYIDLSNSMVTCFTEENIQKVILEDFFFPFMYSVQGPLDLFGKPACELTNNQLTILTYLKIFKNIFDNNQDIPDKIRKNPSALMEYASKSKSKEKMKEHLSKDGASTVFGATAEDYEYMGVDQSSIQKSNSLNAAAKKKGGSLNMQDLMNMS